MTKRATLALCIIALGFVVFSLGFNEVSRSFAQDGGEGEEDTATMALEGSVLYAQYCNACHGPTGEARGSEPAFVNIRDYDPEVVSRRIAEGYDSDEDDNIAMPGFGTAADGPLAETDIALLVAYMSTWNDEALETPHLPEPNLAPGTKEYEGEGDPAVGAIIYAESCYACHGRDAQGIEGAENFPAFEISEGSIHVAATGDNHGNIPAFAEENGGYLIEVDLVNLDAYLNTIEVEEEEEGPQGVNILIIVIGLGAVLAVGGAYMASRRGLASVD